MNRPLTKKEIEVISLLRNGDQVDMLCHRLQISQSTYKWRIRSVREKLNAKTRTHAVAEAVARGIIK